MHSSQCIQDMKTQRRLQLGSYVKHQFGLQIWSEHQCYYKKLGYTVIYVESVNIMHEFQICVIIAQYSKYTYALAQ